jgi:hypothetical protein
MSPPRLPALAASALLLVSVVLLLLPVPSTAVAYIEGAYRTINQTSSCVHSELTCKNGGYFDADACLKYVPCRQTGSNAGQTTPHPFAPARLTPSHLSHFHTLRSEYPHPKRGKEDAWITTELRDDNG